jgi:protein-disulfide isomerase
MSRILLFVVMLFSFSPAKADDAALSSKQMEAVRKIVRDYILENPEIIGDAIEALQEKARRAIEAENAKMIAEKRKDIENDPSSPVGGNPKGDVTIVEFFDYRCGYCKQVHGPLMDLIKTDGKIRMVYKELPVLGKDSELAAKVALATHMQGKYVEFNDALMRGRGQVSEDSLFALAKGLGLDIEKLKKDMRSPEIEKTLKANDELARLLSVKGTPGFIIGEQIVRGAPDPEGLKLLVVEARKKPTKK